MVTTAEKMQNKIGVDEYSENNIKAAKLLCNAGKNGYEYLTQYASGNSVWRNPVNDDRVIVNIKAGHIN